MVKLLPDDGIEMDVVGKRLLDIVASRLQK
jgi:hypothetical protein